MLQVMGLLLGDVLVSRTPMIVHCDKHA